MAWITVDACAFAVAVEVEDVFVSEVDDVLTVETGLTSKSALDTILNTSELKCLQRLPTPPHPQSSERLLLQLALKLALNPCR
jgi:hypothetical protein